MLSAKHCAKCKQTKPFSLFSKDATKKDGFNSWCKDCKAVQTKLWKSKNKDSVKVYAKDYAEKNKAKRASLQKKREASKLKRTPAWLTDFDKLHMECLYQVAAMRTRESGQVWHVDHVIPLQGKTVSGFHVPANLRVIPASENLRKHNSYGNC